MWFLLSSLTFIIFAISYLSWHFYQMLPVIKYKKTVSFMITILLFLLNFINPIIFGFIINLCIAFVLSDLITLFTYKFEKIKKYWVKVYFKGFFAIGLSLLISVYGIYNAHNIVVTSYDITINKQFNDKKILLASDIHLGTTVQQKDLEILIKKAKELKPDMVILAGDIYDESSNQEEVDYSFKVFKELAQIVPVYYVYGNHDFGFSDIGPLEKFNIVENLTTAGVRVLQDEVVELDDMYIIGRNDALNRERKDLSELVDGLDQSKSLILIDHQPKELKKNAQLKIDLQLSGHTHGGQNFPSGEGSVLFGINEINYGYRQNGNYQIIVTSGMGTWGYSMRTSHHSEIVEINIHSGG